METLFIGTKMIFLPEVNSTNSYAIDLLKNVNLPEGTIIHTANQTSGRGQRGNVWNTLPDSNLTASIILKPEFLDLKKQFFLYQVAALACYDVMAEILDSSQYDIKIKWPNDILVNKKKIAGILIENIVMNHRLCWSVTGIGINVKQCEFDEKINATSLQLLDNKKHDTGNILKKLCGHFENYYLRLKNGHGDEFTKNYLSHFFGINEWRQFEIKGMKETMRVNGTDEQGYLLLENKEGAKQSFDIQEIKWII